jgi:AcrR family transcriptional regulator
MPRASKKVSQKREPLSRDRIVLKALALVEREGLHGFSFRKLADDLRCEAMSIYYHFPSKAHLFDAMVAQCLGKIDWLPDDAPWRNALRHGFASFRQVAHKYPAFNQYLVVYRMNSLEGLGMLEKILGIFLRAGFTEEEAAKYFRLTGYYFMGATLDETSGYAKGPSTAEPVPDEVVARDFPAVASVGPFFKPGGFDATFFAGLDLLLDGIERAHENQPKSPV